MEDKEPLVVVPEEANSQEPAGKGETVAGDSQLSVHHPVPFQQATAIVTGQAHIVAVIRRPNFCSTVSG